MQLVNIVIFHLVTKLSIACSNFMCYWYPDYKHSLFDIMLEKMILLYLNKYVFFLSLI